MEEDEIREEINLEESEKPKKRKSTKSKKAAPESGAETIKIDDSNTEEKKTKTRKPISKRKTDSTKKKRGVSKRKGTLETPVIDNSVISEETLNEAIEPTGQGKVSQVKVNVVNSSKPSVSQLNLLPEVTKLTGGKVTTAPTVTQTTRVEASQTQQLPFAAIKVRNVVGKVVDLVAEVICNKVIVQGIVHEQLFFVGTDNIVHHLSDDIHFSTFVDIPGAQPGMNAQVTAIIEEIITELAPDGLSIIKKIILEVFVKITETVQVNFLPGNGPLLLLKQVVGENTQQILIENDFTLDTPAIKIDEIVGKIQDLEVEVIVDKVIIQGILHKQIFYIGTDNIGRHQGEDVHFSLFVDLPGAMPGMDVQVHPQIEVILFELISPTILRQKAVMEFFVKVTENIRQNVTIGNGPLFKVEEFIGEATEQNLTETIVTLPMSAIKVREIVAQVRDIETFVITDKVIVQGTIHKQIFYIGTDNIERHIAEDIPFSLFLDIPGAVKGDNVRITPIIEAVFFELISPTQLRQKVVIAITAVVSRELQLHLILGMGPLFKVEQVVGENSKQVLVVRREEIIPPVSPITVTEITIVFPQAACQEQQIILRNEFELPVTAIKIKEIQAIIKDLTVNVLNNKVIVQGVVEKTIFFVDTDNIVRTITEEVPFSIMVDFPGITPGQPVEVNVEIEKILFNLSEDGDTVIQNIVLRATVCIQAEPGEQVTVVTDVTGPGVVQTKVRVRAFVLTSDGQIVQQEFDVVTAVSGPGIAGVETRVLLLDVVGDGNPNPVPVTVVTRVILE